MSDIINVLTGSSARLGPLKEEQAKREKPQLQSCSQSSQDLASLTLVLLNLTEELKKSNLSGPKSCESCCKDKGNDDSAVDFFYRNIGTVAGLGASITFGLVVSDIADPHSISRHGRFDLSTVRILLAVAWMLFMVVLSLSFSIWQKVKRYDDEERRIMEKTRGRIKRTQEAIRLKKNRVIISTGLYMLTLVPVMCLSLVVAAYVEVVGYFMASLLALVFVALVFNMFSAWAVYFSSFMVSATDDYEL